MGKKKMLKYICHVVYPKIEIDIIHCSYFVVGSIKSLPDTENDVNLFSLVIVINFFRSC